MSSKNSFQCPKCGHRIGGYVSLRRFAQLLDLEYVYAWRLAKAGKFPVERVAGTTALRIPISAVSECLTRKYGTDEVLWQPEAAVEE